ncbi:uncharacterized protein LOC134696618 [Mytilus trossulus]|uniref:uncharacterized protein LOC134696618 n=1 Tax=Mytilus trossulus TaxID=6551 RepID=UPI003004CBF6
MPGKYFGPFYMHCPAPASRRKRSITDESSALGYRLSVSNDGMNFTQELTILIYNSQCLYCNFTSMECIELDTCPVVLVPVVVINSDSNTPLIAGLCGGFATLTIILLIVIVTKKYSKRSNQTQPAISSTGQLKTAY